MIKLLSQSKDYTELKRTLLQMEKDEKDFKIKVIKDFSRIIQQRRRSKRVRQENSTKKLLEKMLK